MPIQNKRTYRQTLKNFFYQVRIHPWYQKVMILPLWVRICISVFLFLFGIVGLLTPIPAGWVMILGAFALVFGLRFVRRHSIRLFFLLRMHRLIEYIRYKWKK